MQAIIADLEAAGYFTRTLAGRRTIYTIHPDRRFRHPAQDGHRIGPFLELLAAPGELQGFHDPPGIVSTVLAAMSDFERE